MSTKDLVRKKHKWPDDVSSVCDFFVDRKTQEKMELIFRNYTCVLFERIQNTDTPLIITISLTANILHQQL